MNTKKFDLQNAEFDAVNKLSQDWRRIQLTPIVDDDYPMVRGGYEESLKNLLGACRKNGRRLFGPTIVCLCGSTRFYEAFQQANYDLTCQGIIVLSVGFYVNNTGVHGESVGCSPELKRNLDELHKRKIDLADQILVLNVGGYIGDSTRSEIKYAERLGKEITYLEKLK